MIFVSGQRPLKGDFFSGNNFRRFFYGFECCRWSLGEWGYLWLWEAVRFEVVEKFKGFLCYFMIKRFWTPNLERTKIFNNTYLFKTERTIYHAQYEINHTVEDVVFDKGLAVIVGDLNLPFWCTYSRTGLQTGDSAFYVAASGRLQLLNWLRKTSEYSWPSFEYRSHRLCS